MPNPRATPLTPREADGLLGELHRRLRDELARSPYPSAGGPDAGGGASGPPSPPRSPDR